MRKCTVEGCEKRYSAKGYCKKHYSRFAEHGDPLKTLISTQEMSIRERLDFHSEKVGDCILWTGNKNKKGYGLIGYLGDYFSTHRLAYIAEHGDIPKGLHVLHTCDVPNCTNPKHLWIGTNTDNILDRMKKGRSNVGQNVSFSKLTDNNVIDIRKKLAKGETCASLAKTYNVTPSNISYIKRNKTWKHISGE